MGLKMQSPGSTDGILNSEETLRDVLFGRAEMYREGALWKLLEVGGVCARY